MIVLLPSVNTLRFQSREIPTFIFYIDWFIVNYKDQTDSKLTESSLCAHITLKTSVGRFTNQFKYHAFSDLEMDESYLLLVKTYCTGKNTSILYILIFNSIRIWGKRPVRGTFICAHAWVFFKLCILITHYIRTMKMYLSN